MKLVSAILALVLSLGAFAQDKPQPVSNDRPHPVSKQDEKMAADKYKKALDLRKQGKIEDALLAATDASQLVPSNSEYVLIRELLKQQIVSSYLERGNHLVETGDPKGAAAQFREALARDPENSYAQQRLKDVTAPDNYENRVMKLLAGVNNVDLQPAPGKKSIHAGPDMRGAYAAIGKAFGVDFSFDQSVTNRQIRIDMDNVDFYTVTSFLGKITKTFWAPISSNQAIVANDTQEMRNTYERLAMRTFYISNATNPTDLNDLVNVMRVIFDMKFVTVEPNHNTITVRAPRPQLEEMASFIDSIMDAKPEIMLVLNEYEFNIDRASNYGINLPTDFTVFNIPSEIRRVLGNDAQTVINALNQNGRIDPSQIPAADLTNLAGSPLLAPFIFFGKGNGLTGVNVPPISATLSASHSFSTNLEHLNLRTTDGEAATFRVGTKFPVVTSNFSTQTFTVTGASNTVNTPQVQYVDLGLTLKATPHYESGGDIKLDLELDIQGLGTQSFNGIPDITSRSFKGNLTAREGEPSVIGGSLSEQEIRSTQGYPGIGQLPILSSVLNTNSKDRVRSEILLVVTPYVVRKPFHDRGASAFWTLN